MSGSTRKQVPNTKNTSHILEAFLVVENMQEQGSLTKGFESWLRIL